MKSYLSISFLSLFVLPSIFYPRPAMAGRAVLNQTPQTIEKSFGRHWTKLTLPPADGLTKDRLVRYTYSPTALRRVFPEFPKATLSMNYRSDRVISIDFSSGGPSNQETVLTALDTQSIPEVVKSKRIEARFFRYIFGYDPSIDIPLSFTGGNFGEVHSSCLGDGAVSTYSIDNLAPIRPAVDFSLLYTSKCSKPYEKIQFTQNLLGG